MNRRSYSMTHHVLYYECEKTQRMTLSMLLSVMIQVTREQGEFLNLTEEKMGQMGYGWIVLQHVFSVNRMPLTDEEIEIETIVKQYNKYFCYREFYVRNMQGEELVQLTMVFALLDIEKRKMTQIPEAIVAPYDVPLVKKPLRIPKPTLVKEECAQYNLYRIRYFDIDANDHVNNSKYVEWMFDGLGEEFMTNHELKSGNIKFEKELLYGQEVTCVVSHTTKGYEITSEHRVQTELGTHCSASFEWTKI